MISKESCLQNYIKKMQLILSKSRERLQWKNIKYIRTNRNVIISRDVKYVDSFYFISHLMSLIYLRLKLIVTFNLNLILSYLNFVYNGLVVIINNHSYYNHIFFIVFYNFIHYLGLFEAILPLK